MTVVADLIYIYGTDALLIVDEASARRMWLAQEVGHQRVHAGGCEKHRRIVLRNERTTGNLGVPVGCKKLNVFPT